MMSAFPLPSPRRLAFAGLLLATTAMCGGCSAITRLGEVGQAPRLSRIENPAAQPGYRPVSLPMPQPVSEERAPNSLWRTGSRAFFRDQRAARVGDLVTVNVTIADNAKLSNELTRSRNNSDTAQAPSLLGYETKLAQILPQSVNPSSLIDIGSTTSNDGKGSVDRSESINLKLAAVVTQILPNGNMVIRGNQEVRVNYEMRDLQIAGVIRPEDISSTNDISYDKIAEARIAYGGRGQITDVQQPRYGDQVFDILFPF